MVQENKCGDIVSVSKDSFWNLKRHISRKHERDNTQQKVSKLNTVTCSKVQISLNIA